MLEKKATRCWGRRPLDDKEKGHAGGEEGSKLIPKKRAIESEKLGKQIVRKRATRCRGKGQPEC
jgi:hypothetical protein